MPPPGMSTRALMDAETVLKILLAIAVVWIGLQLLRLVISGIIATVILVAKLAIAVGFVVLIVMWLTDRI